MQLHFASQAPTSSESRENSCPMATPDKVVSPHATMHLGKAGSFRWLLALLYTAELDTQIIYSTQWLRFPTPRLSLGLLHRKSDEQNAEKKVHRNISALFTVRSTNDFLLSWREFPPCERCEHFLLISYG